MKQRHRWLMCAITVGVWLICCTTGSAQDNSWTNTASGKWEDGSKWSLGVAPTNIHSGTFITNATTKTGTIDATTTNTPTMTISNLTLSAPGVDVNTLQLTDTGAATPLRILNAFTISSGGAVVVTNSVLRVDGLSGGAFTVDGCVTNLAGGQIITTNVSLTIGSTAGSRGNLTSIGGLLQVSNNIIVGAVAGSQGTLTLAGGTNTLSGILNIGFQAGATGVVHVTDALLAATSSIVVGNLGAGEMSVSNSIVRGLGILVGPNGGSGTLKFADVSATIPNGLSIAGVLTTGSVWMTGGQLVVTNGATVVGLGGIGQLTVSNATVLCREVIVGHTAVLGGTHGALRSAGCTNIVSGPFIVGHMANTTGTVWLTDGLLVVTNGGTFIGSAGVGEMTVSNSTVRAGQVALGANGGPGTLTLLESTTTLSGKLTLAGIGTHEAAVWVTGGQLVVTNDTTVIGQARLGQMTVSNATVLCRDVIVGELPVFPGTHGTLTVVGGTMTTSSSMMLGDFSCAVTGTVVVTGGSLFVTNAAATAVLDVRSGTFTQSGGLVEVDILVVTNACGRINFTGGSLFTIAQILTPEFDADGDGIPNGADPGPLDATDSGNDPDGDGFTNLQEFQAGTNPTNSASFLGITSITQVSTDILITWMTAPDKTNALERTAGVAGGFTNDFSVLTNIITTGTTTNYLDIGGALFTNRYYRVRLVP